MKRTILSVVFLLAFLTARPVSAANGSLLVQSTFGPQQMNFACQLTGCQVSYALTASPNNFYVLSVSGGIDVQFLASVLQNIPGIVNVTVVNSNGGLGGRFIVHTTGGSLNLQSLCSFSACQVAESIDGPSSNQVFLVLAPGNVDPTSFLNLLWATPGVVNAEVDQTVSLATGEASATTRPPSLVDTTPVQYYGSIAWEGYVNQPATQIIQLAPTQQDFSVSGSGLIIADIDTGVDPNHPVLQPVLLPGYDFTRNQPGGSEMNDLPGGAPATETPCSNCNPSQVNQQSIAMVDQQSIAMVDGAQYGDFGHGTMVAGVLHLVAPTASIMPLKSFGSNGSGNLSDIIRAIYYAAQNNANIVNMSFDTTTPSNELSSAIGAAENTGIVFVASSGNDGQMEFAYPASYSNVIGVTSTNDQDQRSTFSNYGDQVVWVAAPGEAIVTTYPFGTYAAGWGTSFSAPFVSGEVALLESLQPNASETWAQFYVAQAQIVPAYGMGNGRINLYQATSAASPVF
jgi:subtilisin family serine protease